MARLRVTYVNGTERVVPLTPRAEVEVERKFSIRFGDLSMEQLYYAAWWATGREPAEFEPWLDSLVGVEVVPDDGKAADPTQGTPPPPDSSD